MHFPEQMDVDFKSEEEFERAADSLTCEMCADFKSGQCPGRGFIGRQCFDCIADSVIDDRFEFGGTMFSETIN